MCGIVAYTGFKPAVPILIDGLRMLECDGYDSVGMYVSGTKIYKLAGSVQELVEKIPENLTGRAGMAHTRWGTDGEISKRNAHPQTDESEKILVVHNGIIENAKKLKKELIEKGVRFRSETDTEILANLIAKKYNDGFSLSNSVVSALKKIDGAYGIAVMSKYEPETIVAASKGSKLMLGVKEGEYIISSNISPILRHTSNVVYLNDGEYCVVSPRGYTMYSLENYPLKRKPEQLHKRENIYKHILKDILEIPDVLRNGTKGRVSIKNGNVKLGGLEKHSNYLKDLREITILGCGSSYFAGLIGELLLEEFAGISAKTEFGSEFYSKKINNSEKSNTLLVLSQSGETKDVIVSIEKAKKEKLHTMGIVNAVGSTVSKKIDVGIYNHAGYEKGITSTKSFISQLQILILLSIFLGRLKNTLSKAKAAELIMEILQLPQKTQKILSQKEEIKRMAENYLGYDDFLFVGRKYNVATAYEGAFKFKKLSYLHAEGYPSGEVAHGPITMINEIFPTVAIVPSDSVYEKVKDDIKKIREKKSPVLAIATEGNKEIKNLADDVLYIPDTTECLTPILSNVALQLFAYHTGMLRGFNYENI
jgi:glucosamine--fructose-6-phosphate aminotransferase (isomerizing)